jgi:hypothetical protein
MELITILLSGALSLFSVVGIVVDRNVEENLRAQLDRVDELKVRVDNAPAHQILGGKINKVRIAGKGLWFNKDTRLEELQIESDPLNVDLRSLQENTTNRQIPKTTVPIQGAIKLVFTETDLNNILKSDTFKKRLEQGTSQTGNGIAKDLKVTNVRLKLLGNNRLGIKVDLKQSQSAEILKIDLTATLQPSRGKKILFLNPTATVNGTPVPDFLLSGITEVLSEEFNVSSLAPNGITARILKLEVTDRQLKIAAFVRIEPNRSNS